MDEKNLKQYKKIYLEEKISDPALQKGLDNLMRMLPEQDSSVRNTFFRYRFLFAGIILLMLVGTAELAQAANSGELLYPVKILTNNVAAKIFGKPEITVKREEKKEKENTEKQKDLKQEKKEIRGQEKEEKNKPEQDEREQENQVKGARTEVTEIKKPKSDEREQSNRDKSKHLNNGNANREKG